MHHIALRFHKEVTSIRGKHRALYSLALMLFFFAIFDSVLSYALPVLFTQSGLSKSEMGLVLGFSSIAGAAFDIILSRVITNTDFRKMFLFMIAGCAVYFGSLVAPASVGMYLFAMAVWGLYWNLLSYGLYNFISNEESHSTHASSWGILDIFKGLGLVVAPIIASAAIAEGIGPRLFGVAFIVLAIIYGCYVLLLKESKKPEKPAHKLHKFSSQHGLSTWVRVARSLAPVLMLNILLCTYDLAFMTIGPLISEDLGKTSNLGGVFLTLYYLPTVLTLWTVGPITRRFGKKRTAFLGFGLGAVITALFAVIGLSLALLPLVFLSSVISALAWPALKGAFADYIEESKEFEKEIEILTSFTGNIGCILGPSLVGILSDRMGNVNALSTIGFVCSALAFILWKFTPKHIRVVA